MAKSIKKIMNYIHEIKLSMTQEVYKPRLRVIEISKTESNEFVAIIQIINKSVAFDVYPEEILEDDSFVDMFSPRDVRTLTYLGYMGINSPKYTILAKHLSQENNKIMKDHSQMLTLLIKIKKNMEQLIDLSIILKSTEKDIIQNMCPVDSHEVGYLAATENSAEDFKQKNAVLKNFMQNKT